MNRAVLWRSSGSTYSQKKGQGLGAETARLVLTVVSWNVFGSSQRGMADVRNILVPRVIQRLNPDIALLQETRTNLMAKRILEATRRKRRYKHLCSGKKNESRILYDANLYTSISLNDALDRAIQGLELERRASQVLRGHTTIMGVRKAATSESCSLPRPVFLSFHNTRSREMASTFCQLVKALESDLETLVVAGADMNCRIGSFDCRGTHFPIYTPSKRRHDPIDFYVFSSSPVSYPVVKCEGLVDSYYKKSSKLHKVVRDAVMEMEIETDTLSLAFNHEPLVCELTLTNQDL